MAVVVIGAAYTLATLAADKQFPADIGPFLLIVLGMLLVAHLVVRRLAPDRRSHPVAAGRAAQRARLRGHHHHAGPARARTCPSTWPACRRPGPRSGIAGLRGHPGGGAPDPHPRPLPLHVRPLGIGLLHAAARPPRRAAPVNGSRIWVNLGPIGFQPGEIAKIVLAIFFASYLVEKRELLAMRTWRLGPFNLPEPKHLGPVLVAWGFSIMIMVSQNDLGSSLHVLHPVRGDAVGGHLAHVVPGGRAACCSAPPSYLSWREFAHVKERVTMWLNPWPEALGHGHPDRSSAWFAMANGGLIGTGLGLGNQDSIPYIQTDFIFAAVGPADGPARGHAGHRRLHADRGVGPAHRRPRRPRLRQAAGRRPHHPGRRAGLHHHLGRDPPAAPHRPGPALRVLRRLVAGVELDPDRAAAAHLRRVATARAARAAPRMAVAA